MDKSRLIPTIQSSGAEPPPFHFKMVKWIQSIEFWHEFARLAAGNGGYTRDLTDAATDHSGLGCDA